VGAGDSPAQLCSLEYGSGLSPEPLIFSDIQQGLSQLSSNRIFQHLCHLASEVLVVPELMIERLVLPNPASPIEGPVDPVSRLALDGDV